MRIVVITDDELKDELLQQGQLSSPTIEWSSDIKKINGLADAVIDLHYDHNPDHHLEALLQAEATLVVINSMLETATNLPHHFVRVNGWPTFLQRPLLEASANNDEIKAKAEDVLHYFNKTIVWTPDIPGFITPRVVCSLVNEAYFALEDAVSSRQDMDIAMKQGTNYPYGPFEWSTKIGIRKIYALLHRLSSIDDRYKASDLLKMEATL